MKKRWHRGPCRKLGILAIALATAVSVVAQEVNVAELLQAAEEVARLGANASGHAHALTYQNNRLLQLLAFSDPPQISRQTFEANHRNFLRMFEEFSKPPPGSNVRLSFQKIDPSKAGAPTQYGSDIDAILSSADPNKPLTAQEVSRLRALHHQRAAAFARQHGVPAAGAPNADISFLPDPGSMSEREWRQAVMEALASGEDAVYQCPVAASTEAKIRMGQPITAAEAGARAQEVSRMANESLVTANRLDAAARSVQDPIHRQALEAQAQLQRHYAAKYLNRMVQSSEVLARQHGITPRSTTSQTLITAATERSAETARQAAAVGAMSQHFTAQQTQIFVDNMSAVAARTGGTATAAQAKRHIARALNQLSPAQQGEALEGLRRTDPSLARDVARQMRGMPKPKPPFGSPPEPGALARTAQHIGTAMALYSGYRSLAAVRDAAGPADQFVALEREDRQRILQQMTPEERDRLREAIARRSEGPSWSQLVLEGPTQEQREEAGRQIGIVTGGAAGAKVGIWVYGGIGAGVGTTIAGPIGATVGGVIGGIYGGVVGYYTGSTLSEDLGDTRSSWWDQNLPTEEFNRRAIAAGARTADEVRKTLIRNGIPESLARQAADAYQAGSLDAFNSFVRQARLHREEQARREAILAENRRRAEDHRIAREFFEQAWARTDQQERERERREEQAYRDWVREMAHLDRDAREQAYNEAGLTEEQRNELEQRLGGGIDQRWREYAADYTQMTPEQQREIREQMSPEQLAELDRAIESLPEQARTPPPLLQPPPAAVTPDVPTRSVLYGQTLAIDLGAGFREGEAFVVSAEDLELARWQMRSNLPSDIEKRAFEDGILRGTAAASLRRYWETAPPPEPGSNAYTWDRHLADLQQTLARLDERQRRAYLMGYHFMLDGKIEDVSTRFIFHASPTLTFDPPESADGRTSVIFDRVGNIRIWAQVEKKNDESIDHLETPTHIFEVEPPALEIRFTPAAAFPGQTIQAQITTQPAVPESLITYVWDSPPSADRYHHTANASQISVTPVNANPVTFKAEARVPHHGELIGTVTAVFTPASDVDANTFRQQFIDDGYAHEQRGEIQEAIGLYQAAQVIEADPRVQARIDALRSQLNQHEQAQLLVDEGFALEQKGSFSEALERYEAAQELVHNDGIMRRAGSVREEINRRNRAQQLVNEGFSHEQQQDLHGALSRYREAQRLAANEGLAQRILEVENRLAEQQKTARLAETQRSEASRQAEAERHAAKQQRQEQAARQQTEAERRQREQVEAQRKEAAARARPPVSGSYSATIRENRDVWFYQFQLRQSGNRIEGRFMMRVDNEILSDSPVSGIVEGDQIRFNDGTRATLSADRRTLSVKSDDGETIILRKQ